MDASGTGYESQQFDPERHLVETFRSGGDESLDRWLRESAAVESAGGMSSTSVWTSEGSDEVVAYHSLVAHTVTRGSVSNELRTGRVDPIPAALIGKLALANDLHGGGLGGQLFRDALERLVVASRSGPAFRVIVVDAIDEDAGRLYEHFGFIPVPDRPSRLVIHVGRVAEASGMNAPKR